MSDIPSEYSFTVIHERRCIIRIYHNCEGRIEKSILRIAVWHHEACRGMINGDPEGRMIRIYHECEGRIENLPQGSLFA